jgi:hypothetical protein
MNRTAFFCAGFALASFAPAILGERSRDTEFATTAHLDDKSDEAEAAARKRKKVEELLTSMDQKEVTQRMLDASLSTFTEMGLPEEFQTCFKESFDVDYVMQFTRDIYADHLEESTVDALIAFYKSDEGKTFTKALPDITIDGLKKGTEYGKKIGEDCAKRR